MKNKLLAESKQLFCFLAELKFSGKDIDVHLAQKKLMMILDQIKLSFQSNETLRNDMEKLHYILCTVSDEILFGLMTDYSASIKSLANKYYQDTNGGEKFYHYLQHWLLDVDKNIDLIEMCYVCLTVGFAGKYAVIKGGDIEVKKKLNEISLLIEKQYSKQIFSVKPVRKLYKTYRKKLALILFSLLLIFGSYAVYSQLLKKDISQLSVMVKSVVSGGVSNEN